MTILESRCVGWVVSYHRCSCETHLDQLGFQLLLQVVGLRRSGATGPQLDSQRSQLPAGLHSRWTFITNVDTKLIVRTFWTTYLSDAQVCWQYGICACSHQTTWWTESFEYINLKTEQQQYRNSVTHLESQAGCSLVAVRTVESVGIAVAEMPTGHGESLYQICEKNISFKSRTLNSWSLPLWRCHQVAHQGWKYWVCPSLSWHWESAG